MTVVFTSKWVLITVKITKYSDNPLIVTVLAVPKGVTLNGQPCNTFRLANQLQFMDNMDLKESETSPSWLLTFIDPKDCFLDLMLSQQSMFEFSIHVAHDRRNRRGDQSQVFNQRYCFTPHALFIRLLLFSEFVDLRLAYLKKN